MRGQYLILCVMAVIVAACDSGSDGSGEPAALPVIPVSYEVGISSLQVVGQQAAPSTVTVTADLFSVRDDTNTLNGSVTVNGIEATSVTINVGFPGENGPVAFTLVNDGGETWVVPEDTVLEEPEYQLLNDSGYYASVQTPEGELRGQLLFPGLVAATVMVIDDKVIPAAESIGYATAGFLLDPDFGFVRLRMTIEGLGDVTRAGLRGAITGARGETILAMEASSSNANVWGTPDINDPEYEEYITAEAAGFVVTGSSYFSVETTSNPAGELRGQLVPLGINVVEVAMTDDQVVTSGPPVVSSAVGVASVTWNGGFRQFSVAVNTDVMNAVSVNVYQGAAGEIGPVVLSLTPDVTLPGNWVAQRAEFSSELAGALVDGGLYVGVVTEGNPDGELRGQIILEP